MRFILFREIKMKYKFNYWREFLSVIILFSFLGCGGGSSSSIENSSKTLPIVIIGPSTVYIAHEFNEAVHEDKITDCRLEGWGERLYEYANDEDAIYNYARPGSSSASFFKSPDGESRVKQMLWGPNRDHYWDKTKEKMRELEKGLLLVQYGSNEKVIDEGNFKSNIRRYIDEAKELNFTPILITEIEKRIRNTNETLIHSRGDYPTWIKEVAKEKEVRVLDLNSKSYKEYSRYTDKEWDEKFAKCWGRWNKNKQNTHFEPKGAKIVASWIKELACEDKNSLLCKQLLGDKKPLTLSSNNFIPEHNSPSFTWQNRPKHTKSFALIIDDYDAKNGDRNWVHWVVFNIDKNSKTIKQNSKPSGAIVELNSLGVKSYTDPAYPETHRYVAHLYALDIEDITKAQYANKRPIYKSDRIYDHKTFEKVFGNFILGKSILKSK
jgi:Raf kinase inhibitor-like YbhB/YbcL family protein